MKLFALIMVPLMATGSVAPESSWGANLLKNNSSVSIYREGDNRIPSYVAGNLAPATGKGNEVGVTISFLERHRDAFRMNSPRDEMVVNRIDIDNGGRTHIRFRQHYLGIPVYTGDMLAHFDADGMLGVVNGSYVPEIELDPTPTVVLSEAIATAAVDMVGFAGLGVPAETELIIFPWKGENFLCWRIYLEVQSPMGRWEYFVDAKSGRIVFKLDRVISENDVGTGIGTMGGPRNHIDTDFNGAVYRMIDYTRQAGNNAHGHDGQMPPGGFIETSVAAGSNPGNTATDDNNLWDDSVQASWVDAHVYTTLTYDWMLREWGRNSFDWSGASMLTAVDYTGGTNNANWNGSWITIFGWSSGRRSLAACPDVVAHEWGHAVTQYGGNMIYAWESGALNESFSDMMGAAFEFAHDSLDPPDWYMAENGMINGNGFRSMSNPHEMSDPDFYGPEDDYWVNVINCTPGGGNDQCGVHTNSGVGNKWFYLLSDGGTHHGIQVLGIGVENAMLVAHHSNAYYWYSNVDYHNAALGTISAADDLDSTHVWSLQVVNAWNAVGVSTQDPNLFYTVDTNLGWVPFEVQFEGHTTLSADSWTWDFGDGDSGFVQSPVHIYDQPGLYGIGIHITAGAQTRDMFRPAAIIALADSLVGENVVALPGEQVEVAVHARNSTPITTLTIPVSYAGGYDISYDSFSTVGCRTEQFGMQQLTNYIPSSKRLTINLQITSGQTEMQPGAGNVAKLYFSVSPSAIPNQITSIGLDGYTTHLPMFYGSIVDYAPRTSAGRVSDGYCCVGVRGDVNESGDVLPDVADLTYLVDYLFAAGPAPGCSEEADADSNGSIDIADVSFLVDYLFGGGPMPGFCP